METETPEAFPGMEYDTTAGQRYHYGMTLREWYAGMALQGLVSHESTEKIREMVEDTDYTAAQAIASIAFGIADAMIEASAA